MGLPSGYKRLEYIQSTGTQYINTGFKPNQNTKIVFDFQATDSESSSFLALFGSRTDGSLNCFNMWLQSNTVYVQYGNVDYDAYPISIIRNNRYSFTLDSNVATIGDSSVTLPALTFSGSKQITLFALNREGNTVDSRRTSGKLYSCQIYDNGTLVRDFVPCIKDDGEVGLYDLAGKQFYGNAGTGTFTAGPLVDPYGNDEHTLFLLHGEDLTDSSPYGVSIINNGVSISDAQSKFGGKSLYFNGSSYLSVDLLVAGDMTVDFWAYIQDSSISFPTPFGWDYNGRRCNYIHTLSSVTWFAQNDGRDSIEVSTNGIAHNAWHHIALVRSGNQMLGFIDGVLKTTSTVNYGNNDILTIGVLNEAKSATWFTGFIDEFRVSSIARWTMDFTPPSKPYSSSLNLPVNIGGTWKDANEVFVNIGGTWKTVEAAFVNIGGTWKELG